MQRCVLGDLVIDADDSKPGLIRLNWKGKSNDREPGKILNPYFRKVVDRAAEAQARIEAHFEDLAFFNSSTIGSIIYCVQSARELGVEMTIVFNPGMDWQRLSFEALRVFEKSDGLLKFQATG